jgi:flagellar protein FlaJ
MNRKTGRENDNASKKPSRAPQPLVASPMRDTEGPQEPQSFKSALNSIAVRFPNLKRDILRSDMHYTPAGFVRWALGSSIISSIALLSVAWLFIRSSQMAIPLILLFIPVFYFLSFIYFMNFPRVKAKIRASMIDSDLVFAGRHMLIELKSGVPLFDSMLGISREYGVVSEEFNKVVEKVTLGVPIGVALHTVAENNPSHYFNRVVMQMANSIASGSDVAVALEAALEQISREQVIELKAYGQKLNPIAMFYMVFGIIMPSLGIAFMIIVLSFMGGSGTSLNTSALLVILCAIGLVQFLFLSMIESSRPKFDIGL